MSCRFDKELLTGFFDGELAADEKGEVERHVASCSDCLRELGELKSAVALVKTLPRARAPRSLAAGVSREIAASARVGRFDVWRRSALWVTAAAAGLFIAANVLFFSKLETAPPAAETAGRRSAAPIVAVVPPPSSDKDAGPGADRARALRELDSVDARRELAEKEKAAEGLRAERRAAADEKLAKLDPAAHGELKKTSPEPGKDAAAALPPKARTPAAGAAAPADAAKRDDLALARKLEEERKVVPAPAPEAARPAAPAAKPAPPAAPAAKPPAAALAGAAKPEEQKKADAPPAPPANVYVAAGRNAATCQNVVDGWNRRNVASRGGPELRQQLQPSVASGAPGGGLKSAKQFGKFPEPPEPMVVEVSDAELADLKKELEKQGYVINAATPEQNKLGYVELPVSAAADGKAGQKDDALAAKTQSAARAKEAPAAEGGAKNAQSALPLRRITIWFVEDAPKK
jgi:hypothetical protein